MSPSGLQQPSCRTIGLLTANIHIGAARTLWRGALDAAQARNANLICFPGGRLHISHDFEAERNSIYDLIDLEHFDGLVSWTSALAGALHPPELMEFHNRFRSIPVVSLAQRLLDSPLVAINGYEGMRAVIFHLIDVHHYERIAFIRGPEGHPYATERYEAYIDALKERGIAPDPDLITPGTNWEEGTEAMRVLLEDRRLVPGVDFQAVTAVSDLLAIDAIRLMVARGIHVPNQVGVVGFNDIEEGRLVRPSLTSVSLPFYEQGRQSVEILLDWLDGASVPETTMLDSRLLVRQSCGCPSQSVDLAASIFEQVNYADTKQALKAAQYEIGQQIARVISKKGIAATWAKQLLDAFYQEIMIGVDGPFRVTLDGMLQQGVLDGDETAAWQTAISVLRREVLPSLDAEKRLHAESLFGQARVVIGEAIQRAQVGRQLQIEAQNAMLREIGQALITAYEIESLTDVLAERLPELGIHSGYLALYENPADSLEQAQLVLAYRDDERLSISSQSFSICQLIPDDLLPKRRFSMVVEPLYFQTEPIGYVVLEVGPRDGHIYEVLRGHISSALKGALLFKEADAARRAAERADQIKTRLLANVSHELRTPLNIIIGNAQRLLATADASIEPDLQHIRHSAEHQLRIINDLLDLSRAEIHALDLYPTLVNPHNLISEAFAACSAMISTEAEVKWQLDLPDSLPPLKADPVRLHQILLNLLSNAAKFTRAGRIVLGGEVTPPYLHIWVADTGSGIPPDIRERIYDPFFTHGEENSASSGIGLGLSITRHLVLLHQGLLMLDSEAGRGSTFHVYLPLNIISDDANRPEPPVSSTLWLISNAESAPQSIIEFSQSRHLTIQRLCLSDDPEGQLASDLPAVIAWDVVNATPDDWLLIRRLHNHPKLHQTPFIFYQQDDDQELVNGLTSLVVKPASSESLWQAIRPTLSGEQTGSIIIIDDDPRARQLAYQVVNKGLPHYTIQMAENGRIGLETALRNPPSLVILDLMMPEMDGFTVLEQMRADDRTRQVPVVILSGRQLSIDDIKRLEQHTSVLLRSKDIFSEDEIIASLHQALFDTSGLPPQTSALAKRTLAYLHQNFDRPLTREEIAQELGVSEDYLSRIFNQELGLSPWDYLNRYRIARAKELLLHSLDSISDIGRRVGFADPAYFSRVFRKITGLSAREFREQ